MTEKVAYKSVVLSGDLTMKLLRINGAYFTEDNKFMIQKAFDGEWNVYKAFKPFMGEYDDANPSEMLGKPTHINGYSEMLQLKNKVIFWYGLV